MYPLALFVHDMTELFVQRFMIFKAMLYYFLDLVAIVITLLSWYVYDYVYLVYTCIMMWNRTHVKYVIIVSDKINDLMLCHIVNFQNESYVCKYVAKLNRVFFFIVLRTESYSCYWVCFADVLCYYRKTKALKTTIVHD